MKVEKTEEEKERLLNSLVEAESVAYSVISAVKMLIMVYCSGSPAADNTFRSLDK